VTSAEDEPTSFLAVIVYLVVIVGVTYTDVEPVYDGTSGTIVKVAVGSSVDQNKVELLPYVTDCGIAVNPIIEGVPFTWIVRVVVVLPLEFVAVTM
jgi:hypothetical protein